MVCVSDDQHLGDSCLKQRPTYQSSKNSLLVHFTTDSSTTKQGFMLQYVARKGMWLTATSEVKC